MKSARLRCLLALAALGLGLALLGGAASAAQAAEGWAYEMANEMMSPFCPGRSIADCPSPQAQTLRMWLIVQESAGRPRAEVEAELVSRYGESILGAPPAKGIGLTAYLIPVAVVAAGAALLTWFLRRQTRAAPIPKLAGAGAALDPELERLVDEKLAER
ncbi:MAG TPA: cytochrome c-type biogenesis protein CcmH [Myxococcota bacterium]